MDINKIFMTGAVKLPWPTVAAGASIPSDMQATSLCVSCTTRECIVQRPSLLGKVCEFGLSYYGAQISGVPVVVYGLTGLSDRQELVKRFGRARKNELQGRNVTQAEISNWIEGIKRLDKMLQEEQDAELGEKLEALHETPKLAEEIRRAAESLILSKDGNSLEDKLLTASQSERTIFKASELLVETFDLLTVFLNPESAGLGEINSIEPYRLIHKLSFVLNTRRDESQVRRQVRFIGESRKRYKVLDSFKIVPMTLLNNALKYSLGRQDIEVSFEDSLSNTKISISSVGPLIEPADSTKIFQRGYRGQAAKRLHSEGMGIGLYVAQAAARANGTWVQVQSTDLGTNFNGHRLARNCFSFEVRDVPPRSTGARRN